MAQCAQTDHHAAEAERSRLDIVASFAVDPQAAASAQPPETGSTTQRMCAGPLPCRAFCCLHVDHQRLPKPFRRRQCDPCDKSTPNSGCSAAALCPRLSQGVPDHFISSERRYAPATTAAAPRRPGRRPLNKEWWRSAWRPYETPGDPFYNVWVPSCCKRLSGIKSQQAWVGSGPARKRPKAVGRCRATVASHWGPL
jgi:hypothetical protein